MFWVVELKLRLRRFDTKKTGISVSLICWPAASYMLCMYSTRYVHTTSRSSTVAFLCRPKGRQHVSEVLVGVRNTCPFLSYWLKQQST